MDKGSLGKRIWIKWNHTKYLLRTKPKFVGEPTESEDMFCEYCGKPAMVRWLDRRENIGYGEEFYDGMHLRCYVIKNGCMPKIITQFKKEDEEFGNKPYEI